MWTMGVSQSVYNGNSFVICKFIFCSLISSNVFLNLKTPHVQGWFVYLMVPKCLGPMEQCQSSGFLWVHMHLWPQTIEKG